MVDACLGVQVPLEKQTDSTGSLMRPRSETQGGIIQQLINASLLNGRMLMRAASGPQREKSVSNQD